MVGKVKDELGYATGYSITKLLSKYLPGRTMEGGGELKSG